jgi:hypothetical protein
MANLYEKFEDLFYDDGTTIKDFVELMDTPGFDVNSEIPGKEKHTLLMEAVTQRNPDVAEELLKRGAKLHNPYRDIYTDYPFVVVLLEDKEISTKIKMIDVFLKHGFDVNQTNRLNETLLFLACRDNHKELVDFLLSKGATIDQVILDMAVARGYTDIANTLELWKSQQVVPAYKEATGRYIDEDVVADIRDFMGKGKRQKTNRRKRNPRKTSRRKRNARKTNKKNH